MRRIDREKNVACTLVANAHLLDDMNKKHIFDQTIPQSVQFKTLQTMQKNGTTIIAKAIQELHKPYQTFQIDWNNTNVYIVFFKPLVISIKDIISSFQEYANKKYLRDNLSIIFENYKLILDNFQLYKPDSKTTKFSDFWPWGNPLPVEDVIYDFEVEVNEEKTSNLTINNFKGKVPQYNKRVTDSQIIWYQPIENEPFIAIFSENGFKVGQIVKAIQTLMINHYKEVLGEDLFDNDIGVITELVFNPQNKHVHIGIVFD